MKIAISALLLSLASATACAAGYSAPPDSVAQRSHARSPHHMRENGLRHLSISLVGLEPESMELVLIGTIDVGMAQSVKEYTERYPIRAVVVDSYGGNIDSAMDIAAILRAKKLDLIVDGRCLSACANYLFPAAARKTVLPGSVVGIHNIRVTYQEKGAVALVPATDAARLFQSRGDMNSLEQFERTQRREQAFYRDMGIRQDNYQAYLRYLANRKANFGTETIARKEGTHDGCPPVEMWALDRAQLESMGVQGIGEFWFPATDAEKQALALDLAFSPSFLYYGSATGMAQLCSAPPGAWSRLARRFKEAYAGLRGHGLAR
ncbi:MAG: hypothetical protein RSH52_12860 [Janthinobacterium sp.]